MARTPARSVTEFEVKFENSYTQFQLGFEQGSNPRAWSRLLALSLLNAGRTMVKPMKQEAPVRTGRLRNSINALDTYWSTIDKYFTDKVFKDRITKFRKTR